MPSVAHRGRGRRTMNEINMVPFIDVMLVLLIIFMVTAPLITPSLIDLPSVGKGKNLPQQVIQVSLGKDEALEATAIGLFAAIPAVIAYNRFARDIDRIAIQMETFIEEFSNILQRNASQPLPPAGAVPQPAAAMR